MFKENGSNKGHTETDNIGCKNWSVPRCFTWISGL